jgi:hypothetical protein
MKNYRKISLIGLLSATLFFSCSNDDDNTKTVPKNVSNCSFILDANPQDITTLTPETLNNLCAPDAIANSKKGTSRTYRLFIRNTLTVGEWKVFSGSGITFNDGELTATGSTVKINFSDNFTAGSIKAVGTLPSGEMYGPILNFKAGKLF